MSRVFSDWDERDEEQRELGLGAGGPIRGEPAGAGGPRGRGEPARAEFFRAQRRPVLPFLGLAGAVATVVIFLWLGSDDVEPPPGELAPVASAPDFEVPFPEPGAASLAAPPADTAGAAAPATNGQVAASAVEAEPVPVRAEPEPAPAEVAAAAPRPEPRPPAAARAGFSVQLLAARSETDVGASWDRLRGAHADLLASLEPTVARTERGQGDTFYRLRAGPLPDRAAADALCKALSARQQPCFVVSPGS